MENLPSAGFSIKLRLRSLKPASSIAHPSIPARRLHHQSLGSNNKGVFCQSEAGLDTVQSCYKPEAWGAGMIRLIAVKKGTDVRLSILAETPKQLEAAN